MRKIILQAGQSLLELIYPTLCLACREKRPPQNQFLCIRCHVRLPQTKLHLEKENLFTERYWGRILLESAAAIYYFEKGSPVQKMIHALKYDGDHHVGFKLGQWYGKQLSQSIHFNSVEIIVPVPLHPRKKKQRGYNQSDTFAQGLSESMHVPWLANGLKRTRYGASQTKKSREERLINVMEAFDLDDYQKIQGKHILLVDDVLTTGATLEACASKILTLPNTRVSMVCIAIAKHS